MMMTTTTISMTSMNNPGQVPPLIAQIVVRQQGVDVSSCQVSMAMCKCVNLKSKGVNHEAFNRWI